MKKKGLTWLDDFLASRPLMRRLVARIVRPDEIEDIVQETFVLSYAASRRKQITNPRAFMLRTACNLALNFIKRAENKGHVPLDEFEHLPDDLPALQADVESRYQSDQAFVDFCRAAARLPLECRRVFILKKVYGLSQKEIAERLDISVSTVEKHVAKGMAMTGRYMVTRGYWDEPETGRRETAREVEAR